MKRLSTLGIFLLLSLVRLSAQDNNKDSTDSKDSATHAPGWRFAAGLNLVTVPTYHIVGTDTNFNNSLSLGPSISLSHSSGFSVSYSPRFVMGGANQGLYMHAVSVGFAKYDQALFDYGISYGHYFFTGNSSIPYTPLSNEIYLDLSYKKAWLRPYVAAGIGFGKNTTTKTSTSVSDVGVSAGFNHSFDWESGDVGFSFIPAVLLNAGTNDYFSFLNITKYIGHSNKSVNYVKNGTGSTRRGGRGGSSGGTGTGGTTTTTTTTTTQKFGLTNLQLNMESSIDFNNFSIRPTVSVFFPVGNAASGNETTTFWQLSFEYKF
jgi:hypothetical protein